MTKLNSNKSIVYHYIEFVKHIYDFIFLWQKNPSLLSTKLQAFLLNNSDFLDTLKKESVVMVNICNNDIMTHFAEKYPELSKTDLEFCSLICLGFPSHTMQTFYELNNSTSYYNRRKRLRTKLRIDTSSNLDTFIREQIKEAEQRNLKQ